MINTLIILSIFFVFLAFYSLGNNKLRKKSFALNFISTFIDVSLLICCITENDDNIFLVALIFLGYNISVILYFGLKKLAKEFAEFKEEFDKDVNQILAEYPETNDKKKEVKRQRTEVASNSDDEKINEILAMLEEKGL